MEFLVVMGYIEILFLGHGLIFHELYNPGLTK